MNETWMRCLAEATVDELDAMRKAVIVELVRRTAGAVPVWDGHNGKLTETPSGGAVLHVEWAVSDRSYSTWYPTLDGAKAQLLRIASAHDRAVADGGMSVDLTAYGCNESRAYVVDCTAKEKSE